MSGRMRELPVTWLGPKCSHRGWIPGYTSSLPLFPEYGMAIAFMINTDAGIVDVDRPVVREIEDRLAAVITRSDGD